MTIANDALAPELGQLPMDRRRRRIPVWAWLLVAFMLISFARVVTGSNELDSAGTLREAITAFIPMTAPRSIVQPSTTAPWPTVTLSPMMVGWAASV
jgi:hypothetical protein